MALSDNMRGAVLMLCSMSAFTLNDACMKALSDELPLFQAIFLRSLLVTAALGVMAWQSGAFSGSVPPKDRNLIVLRSLAEVGAAFFFISALFNMPIANVTAIIQVLPLTVTLAGAVVLGEVVGWRRLLAIMIGFFGVVLIIRPGAEGFNTYALYVLLAVVFVTIRDLCARKISDEVSSMKIALAAVVAVLIFSGLGMISETRQPISALAAAQLCAAAVFIIGGYICSVATMRVGEIGFIAPFRYSSLLVALILGWLIFREWPDIVTLTGAAIVVGTGLYTIYRETRGKSQ